MAVLLTPTGQISCVHISPSIPIRENLLIQRSEYFRGYFQHTQAHEMKRALGDFLYPDGAPFSENEFKLALLLLNATSSELLTLHCNLFLLSNSTISHLDEFLASTFLSGLSMQVELSKVHRLLVDLANKVGWDSCGVQRLCSIVFQEIGLPKDVIYKSIFPSSGDLGRFVSHKLKKQIRNYRRIYHHYWATHARHFSDARCPVCGEGIEPTPLLKGPQKKIEYIGCCFSKVHASCFSTFLRSTYQKLAPCPACQTMWAYGRIDHDMDSLFLIMNRHNLLNKAEIIPSLEQFRRFSDRAEGRHFRLRL